MTWVIRQNRIGAYLHIVEGKGNRPSPAFQEYYVRDPLQATYYQYEDVARRRCYSFEEPVELLFAYADYLTATERGGQS